MYSSLLGYESRIVYSSTMDLEYEALIMQKTSVVVPQLADANVITCRWVFTSNTTLKRQVNIVKHDWLLVGSLKYIRLTKKTSLAWFVSIPYVFFSSFSITKDGLFINSISPMPFSMEISQKISSWNKYLCMPIRGEITKVIHIHRAI